MKFFLNTFRCLSVFASALCLCNQVSVVNAQSLNPAERFLEEQARERQLLELRERTPGLEVEPNISTDAPPTNADTICFDISSVDVEGNTVLPFELIREIAAGYEGHCVGENAINDLLDRLTGLYAERGFITTRPLVPEQDISSGVLRIMIVEGRIEAFILESPSDELSAPAIRRKLLSAFGTHEGDRLQLRDLEQGLDQINRLQSQNATLDLEPGDAAGGSRIRVKLSSQDRFRGIIGIDNEGSDLTGASRLRFGTEIDDLFRVNDTWSLFLIGGIDSNNLAFSGSVPFGRNTFSASASYSDSVSFLNSIADLTTRSAQGRLEFSRLMFRDGRRKLNASASISRRFRERFINDAELEPQHSTVLRFGGSGEFRGAGRLGIISAGISFGMPILGADRTKEADHRTPKAQFTKLDGSFQAVRAWPNGFQLFLSGAGQWSPDGALRSDDQLGIGGRTTVRGYENNAFSGENGGYARLEASIMPAAAVGALMTKRTGEFGRKIFDRALSKIQPYAFFDAGWAQNVGTGEQRLLAGAGAGMRLNMEHISLDLAIAHGIGENRAALHGRATELYFNLTLRPF